MLIYYIMLLVMVITIIVVIGTIVYIYLNKNKKIISKIPPKCSMNGDTLVIPCLKRGYCFIPDELAMYSTYCDEKIDNCGNNIGKSDGKKPKIINKQKMWFRKLNYDPICREIVPTVQLDILQNINK